MHAMVIGSGGLEAADVPVPEPGSHQLLVKVRYAALNRADLAMAADHSSPPMAPWPPAAPCLWPAAMARSARFSAA